MPQDGSLHMLAFEATQLPGHTKKHQLKQLLVSQDQIVPRLDVSSMLPLPRLKHVSGGVPNFIGFS